MTGRVYTGKRYYSKRDPSPFGPPPGVVRIGFTGTQRGMSYAQEDAVVRLVRSLKATDADHGMCVGADAQFHRICVSLDIRVYGHPPTKGAKMMDYDPLSFLTLFPRKDYLARNHDIVDCSSLLIGAPCTNKEELRSGTWATVRYARSIVGKLIYVVIPDGDILDGRSMLRAEGL